MIEEIEAIDYDGLIVDEITIKSNQYPKQKILSILDLKEGDPVTKDQLRIGFKNLYSLKIFEDVSFDVKIVEIEGESRVNLTIIANELPVIKEITFLGNQKYSDDILVEEIPAQVGSYYTEALMREVRFFIKDKYREDGYLMTEVSTSIKSVVVNKKNKKDKGKNKEIEVIIDIREGLEMLVGKIRFYGNDALSAKKIKQAMETKEDKWFREGKFDDTVFELDKDNIINRYKKEGYFRVKIDDARLSYRWKNPKKKKSRSTDIDIWINEGDLYYFGQTTIKGNKLFSTAELRQQIRRQPGDYYDEEIHQQDIERLTLIYHSRGYIFARVTPIEQVNEEDKTVDYVFDIYEGDKAHIEKIFISGNNKTKEHVIRREIEIREGEIFNRLKIQRSLEKLVRTQYFANVVPEPKPGSVEGLMNLIFEVEEQRTGIISAGAGWGTSSGFSLNFEVKEINFLGKGWTIGARADLGLTRQIIDLSFTEPYLLGEPLSARFSLSFYQVDRFLSTSSNGFTVTTNTNDSTTTTNILYHTFTQDEVNELPDVYRSSIDTNRPVLPYKSANIGLGVNTGYRFGDWFTASMGLNYNVEFEHWDESIRLDGIHPLTQRQLWEKHKDKFQSDGERDGLALSQGLKRDPIHTLNVSLGISRDSRDNFIEPHRGSYLKLNLNLITLNYRVSKWNLHLEWNKTFLWKFTFHIASDLFTLGPLFSDGFVYPEDRYYFFYQEELRGWAAANINNHRQNIVLPLYNGEQRGGWNNLSFEDLLVGNASGGSKIRHTIEIRWPFVDGIIGGAIFLDAGNIARRELTDRWIGYLYDPAIYMYSWGFGIRIHIPQFPIQFYFPWRFTYNPENRALEYWEMREQNGTIPPGFVFTVAGFF